MPFDEAAYQAALVELDAALAADETGDHGWMDDLPETGELPDGPDETQALIIPQREKRA